MSERPAGPRERALPLPQDCRRTTRRASRRRPDPGDRPRPRSEKPRRARLNRPSPPTGTLAPGHQAMTGASPAAAGPASRWRPSSRCSPSAATCPTTSATGNSGNRPAWRIPAWAWPCRSSSSGTSARPGSFRAATGRSSVWTSWIPAGVPPARCAPTGRAVPPAPVIVHGPHPRRGPRTWAAGAPQASRRSFLQLPRPDGTDPQGR